MRIYEYAKKNKTTSKELLELLGKNGFDFPSHMSILTPDALGFLDKLKKPGVKKEREGQAPVKKGARKAVVQDVKSIEKIKPEKAARLRQSSDGQAGTLEKPKTKGDADKAIEKSPAPKKRNKIKQKIVSEKIIAPVAPQEPAKPKKLVVKPMVLGDFAEIVQKPATEIIVSLLKWGIVCAKNQMLSEEIVQRLADHYNIEYEIEAPKEASQVFEKVVAKIQKSAQQERLPVVVVMGHVDHGKTTLLDFIRKSRVAAREKGGITQHLGAYEVETPHGGIVFLDTPGHEAFSRIRMRGARAADIAILVIAADDGVMPQTVESIKHAKSVGLPIIVAINKVDKVRPEQIDRVKQGLSKHGLLPEDWGGDVVSVPISAKSGQGIDQLLSMVILQSQMMELQADKHAPAVGYVLESKMQKGRGPVATVILQHGVAEVGDFFVCGKTCGKISSMINSYGLRVKKVDPSIPVQVAGFENLPEAGDYFEVIPQAEYKKARQGKREQKKPLAKMVATGDKDTINIIIKADSDSSKEALVLAIEKLSKDLEKGFNIVNASVGDISESDIDLAAISKSILLGLHVKAEAKSSSLAQHLGVSVKIYDIIYKLMDFLQEYSESMKEIKTERKKVGEAEVLRVFDIKGLGVIAGCAVKNGIFSKGGFVIAYRGKQKVGEGKIKSLQREKKSVKEVHAGFECGFIADGFSDWEVGDRVECYLEVPQEK